MGNYHFVIQKVNPELDSDSATLVESINYINFLYGDTYSYETVPTISQFNLNTRNIVDVIPVGTIEFVESFIDLFKLNKTNLKPIFLDMPDTKLVHSKMELLQEFQIHKKLFIKPFNEFKSLFSEQHGYLFTENDIDLFGEETYFVSKPFDILSEYRSFVFNNQLSGVYNYSGDNLLFPTPEEINYLQSEISKNPLKELKAYTLDFALTTEGLKIIEKHPFFSCGLYGFSDYKVLTSMYISAFKYLTQ